MSSGFSSGGRLTRATGAGEQKPEWVRYKTPVSPNNLKPMRIIAILHWVRYKIPSLRNLLFWLD
jgi:hypothetical protein